MSIKFIIKIFIKIAMALFVLRAMQMTGLREMARILSVKTVPTGEKTKLRRVGW
ncbi:hypothetical protein AAIR98_000039 [Elusimicrobium simillimum]|uniref:hypothetical protein n=1 Tax=Elusimicrobium simillimum TaxID=3143438 RepID=UPI003C7009F6